MEEQRVVSINIADYEKRKKAGFIQIIRHSPGVFTFAATQFDPNTGAATTSPQMVTVSIEQIEKQLKFIREQAEKQVSELTVFLDDLKKEEANAVVVK